MNLHKRFLGPTGALIMVAAVACSCRHSRDAELEKWWNGLPEQIFEKTRESVYMVMNKCDMPIGTAFVVKHGGKNYLVTARHVVRGYELDQLKFVRQEGGGINDEFVQVEIKEPSYVQFDDIKDVAVLSSSNIENLSALELSPDADKHIRVFSIGMGMARNYFGMSITEGIIANPQKAIVPAKALHTLRHVEHTAKLLFGNSGGPLVDIQGRVIGVNVMAGGEKGLIQYFATALRPLLEEEGQKGGMVRINNNGMGRIKKIAVTNFGEEPADQDILPNDLGKINGRAFIQFRLPKGRYTVTMLTEESNPTIRELEVKDGEDVVIDYSYADSGFRVFNTSCNVIQRFMVVGPDRAARLMELQASGQMQEWKSMIEKADVLGEDVIFPGQVWVEYITPGNWFLGAFKIDMRHGLIGSDIPAQSLESGQVKDIYIR